MNTNTKIEILSLEQSGENEVEILPSFLFGVEEDLEQLGGQDEEN